MFEVFPFGEVFFSGALSSAPSTYRPPTWTTYSFLSSIPSGFTESRGTSAYMQDADGVWRQRGPSDPLIGPNGIHVIPAISQASINTVMSGAVVGTVGSGGELPTGWSFINTGAGSIICDVLEIVSAYGLTGIKIRIHGTLGAGSNIKSTVTVNGQQTGVSVNDVVTAMMLWKGEPGSLSGISYGYLWQGTGSYTSRNVSVGGGQLQLAAFGVEASTTHNRSFVIYKNIEETGDVVDITFTIFSPQIYKIPQAPRILLVGTTAQSSNAEVITWNSVPSAPFSCLFDVRPCQLSGRSGVKQTVAEFYMDANNYLRIERSASRILSATMVIGGSTVETVSLTPVVYDNIRTLIGLSLRSDGFSLAVNGIVSGRSSAAMTVPAFTAARIGNIQDNTQAWWGFISNIKSTSPSISDVDLLSSTNTAAGYSAIMKGLNYSSAEFTPATVPGTEGTTYTYPNRANFPDFDYISDKLSANSGIVRVPFLWERLQRTLGGSFNSGEQASLMQTVSDLRSKGLTVIIDPHNYGQYRLSGTSYHIGTTQVTQAHFVDFWSRLCVLFKNDPNVWFGLMNEPSNMSGDVWWPAAQAATNAIRGLSASNMLLVPGISWTGAHSWVSSGNSAWAMSFSDPASNYCFEVHQYFDTDASGTTSTAVSTTIGVERIQAFESWCATNVKKGFMGEFGFGSDATSITCARNFLAEIAAHPEIWTGWTAWGAGPWWDSNYQFLLGEVSGADTAQLDLIEEFL